MQISNIRKHQLMMMGNWTGDALRTMTPFQAYSFRRNGGGILVVANGLGKYLDRLLRSFFYEWGQFLKACPCRERIDINKRGSLST